MVAGPTSALYPPFPMPTWAPEDENDRLSREIGGLPPEEWADLLEQAHPLARDALIIARFRYRPDEFMRYVWPDRFDLPFNDLHNHLFARHVATPPWLLRTGTGTRKEAIAAPRGYAKSTIESFGLLAHDVCYEREAYTLLLASNQRLSLSLSRDLRQQFLPLKKSANAEPGNPRLSDLYGPFRVTGPTGEWEVSRQGLPSVGFLARSFDTEVRGAKHPTRGIRVTKAVIDDGEAKDHVHSPDQRLKLKNNLEKDVLKTGRRQGGSLYRMVGTVLHPDSLLNNKLGDPGWKGSRWKAIIKWPTDAEIWERCHRIWSDLTLGQYRETAARAFFEANRPQMEAGAELLDPASRNLFDLYVIIWSEGLGSFLCELQNDPIDPTAQIFYSQRFTRFKRKGEYLEVIGTGRQVPISELTVHLHWDPASGTQHGDYAAIAAVGRDRYRYAYVLDCWMRRAKASEQLAAAWTIAERWNARRCVVESQAFNDLVLETYVREREERQKSKRYYELSIVPEPATQNKELRIATLEPDITNGWVLFADNIPQDVLGQFDAFPTADHDDGPDAIHGAWHDSGGRAARMVA